MCRHKIFKETLNAVKFLDWFKKFGPAQNILGPVRFDTDDTVTVILKAKRVGKFQLDRILSLLQTSLIVLKKSPGTYHKSLNSFDSQFVLKYILSQASYCHLWQT